MPATSPAQATLFRIAEQVKKGKIKKSYSPAATKIAKTLAMSKVKEFTHEAK
jgi:hypothetical protein